MPLLPWVIVLAGGEGIRLAAVTRDAAGRHVPKQFNRFGDNRSILGHALERAGRLTTPDRIIPVVQGRHECWWRRELAAVPERNVVVQFENRGTAVALLRASSRIWSYDRDSYIVVLPSDHAVDDERAWHRTLHRAVAGAIRSPEHLVLVGMEGQTDADYGWIVLDARTPDGLYPVVAFVEKPTPTELEGLMERGAVCSTFAFATAAAALLALFSRHAPVLLARHMEATVGSEASPGHRVSFEDLPTCDFSRDLLERAPEHVLVLRGEPCGWTDLGTPARLERWLRRHGDPAAGMATAVRLAG